MPPAMSFPPGPRAPAIVQTAMYVRDPVTALERWAARHGDLFTIRIAGFGNFVFAAAPRELRQIFTADPETMQTGVANGQILPLVGPASILTLDGRAHHRHRRLMLPPFHGDRMATYATEIRDVTRRTMATWPRGTAFALQPHMLQITLETILRTVFGVTDRARLAEEGSLFSALIEGWSTPLLPMLAFYGIDAIRLAPWLRVARTKRALDRLLGEEIESRRAAPRDGTDVFSLMLAARDEDGRPLSAAELRDELITLMVAGHETSATTLAWAFERILVHPEVLAAVRAEIAANTDASGELGSVDKLVYLDAVVRETLRQRPIFAFLARKTTVPFEIGDHRVPAGTFLCPAIHLAHRRAETYPDPERFDPARFLGKKVDPYAWLPFGGGGRRCLGMAFAMFEIKQILATVLGALDLRLEGCRPLDRTLRGVAVAPAGGTRVILR